MLLLESWLVAVGVVVCVVFIFSPSLLLFSFNLSNIHQDTDTCGGFYWVSWGFLTSVGVVGGRR